MKIMPVGIFFVFFVFFSCFHESKSRKSFIGHTSAKKKKKNRRVAIMVVNVCGTGRQIFVENDHKLGCAASVEHTPYPLGRPRSYYYRGDLSQHQQGVGAPPTASVV